MLLSKRAQIDRFNAHVEVGAVIRVWPGLRDGAGRRATVLAPVVISPAGEPWVPVRYLEGQRTVGSDHVALTHAARKVEV